MSDLHDCNGRLPSGCYGAAIDQCYGLEEEPGKLFVSNGDYVSQVCFCPYCGEEAQVKPELDKKPEKCPPTQP